MIFKILIYTNILLLFDFTNCETLKSDPVLLPTVQAALEDVSPMSKNTHQVVPRKSAIPIVSKIQESTNLKDSAENLETTPLSTHKGREGVTIRTIIPVIETGNLNNTNTNQSVNAQEISSTNSNSILGGDVNPESTTNMNTSTNPTIANQEITTSTAKPTLSSSTIAPAKSSPKKPTTEKVKKPETVATTTKPITTTTATTTASTTTTTASTAATTTTTTTTTTPKSKKPTITYSREDNPEIYSEAISHSSQGKNIVEELEQPIAQPSQEQSYDNNRINHTDYIIPIVSLIFAVPILMGAVIISLRRIKDYWSTRHYRRMDFLVDGMYND